MKSSKNQTKSFSVIVFNILLKVFGIVLVVSFL